VWTCRRCRCCSPGAGAIGRARSPAVAVPPAPAAAASQAAAPAPAAAPSQAPSPSEGPRGARGRVSARPKSPGQKKPPQPPAAAGGRDDDRADARRGTAVIVVTFIIAIVCGDAAAPSVTLYRPQWVTLVLILLALACPAGRRRRRVRARHPARHTDRHPARPATPCRCRSSPIPPQDPPSGCGSSRSGSRPCSCLASCWSSGCSRWPRWARRAAPRQARSSGSPGGGALLWPWAYFILRDCAARFRWS